MKLFEDTSRPAADLFFRHYDPSDVRLGAAVASGKDDYPAAEVVILGCPQDEGVRRNQVTSRPLTCSAFCTCFAGSFRCCLRSTWD
jgi:hypothetical protein